MDKFKGYEDASKAARVVGSEKIPVGAYVCKILKAEYVRNEKFNTINVFFDVSEGEYKDFFNKQYKENTAEDKQWKGKARIYCPKDDGSEQDEWTKKTFARWTNALEDSNKGYSWDWDESKWKGLTVGVLFGETGSRINGKDIKYVEARTACSAQDVRDGKAPIDYFCKFKSKNDYGKEQKPLESDWQNIPDIADAEELPF